MQLGRITAPQESVLPALLLNCVCGLQRGQAGLLAWFCCSADDATIFGGGLGEKNACS